MPLCCVLYLQRKLSEEDCEVFSEEDWAQLEEAASHAKVVKVKMNVDYSARVSRALAVGFSKNPLLTEVKMGKVPEELVDSVQGTLCTNTALTVKVSEQTLR